MYGSLNLMAHKERTYVLCYQGCHLESAEEVIPDREENRAGAAEETGPEEIDVPKQSRQPTHPRVANEVQIEKIIDDIDALAPLMRSKASHLYNFCGHFAFFSITEPTKVDEASMESE